MSEEQKNPERRSPRHVARSSEGKPKEEETKTYVVIEGQTWGSNPELEAGDTVELTEAEAAGFEDKLEPADKPKEESQQPGATSGASPSSTGPTVPRRPS